MILYFEIIIFINMALHYLLSKATARFYRIKLSYKRILISLIVDAFYCVLYFQYSLYYTKYFFGLILVLITFKQKKVGLMVFYYAFNIFLGGLCYSWSFYQPSYIVLGVLIVLILGELLIEKKTLLKKDSFFYEAYFNYMGEEYHFNAFLDTGNDLVEPKTNLPVVIVRRKIEGPIFTIIEAQTINGTSFLKAYYCPCFYLKIQQKYYQYEVYVVSEDIKYQGLLNIRMF